MLDKISKFLKVASEEGIRLPLAFDPDKGSASVTMLFAYVSFFVALGSIVYLAFQNAAAAVTSAIILWTLTTVFYLMRRINKFKADLTDESIELENGESNNQKENK